VKPVIVVGGIQIDPFNDTFAEVSEKLNKIVEECGDEAWSAIWAMLLGLVKFTQYENGKIVLDLKEG